MSWPTLRAIRRSLRLRRPRRRVLGHLLAVLLALVGNTPAALTAPAAHAAPLAAAPAAPPAQLVTPEQLGLVPCTLGDGTPALCAPHPPPDLLTLGDGVGGLSDGRLYAATPEQARALRALQAQAVADLIGRHGLSAGDASAVLSWGRDDALAELYLLLVDALSAPSPTDDQKHAAAWARAVAQRRAVAAAASAGLEYVKWAGLDQGAFAQLLNRNASKSELEAFLSPQPVNYGPHPNPNSAAVDAPGGYCVYRSPAPYADEYKGYTNPDCAGPVQQVIPPPAPPTFDQFVKYGQAVTNYSLLDSAPYQDQARRIGIAFGVAVGVAALAYAPLVGTAAATGASLLSVTAYFPFFGKAIYDTAFVTGSMSAVYAGAAAGALVVIAALAIAVVQTLNLVDQAKLPGQLAALIDDARTTPPAAAELVSATSATPLLTLFVGATLPRPSPRSCDNADPLARNPGLTILGGGGVWTTANERGETVVLGPRLQLPAGDPCLNPTPIREASTADPQFVVTSHGDVWDLFEDNLPQNRLDEALCGPLGSARGTELCGPGPTATPRPSTVSPTITFKDPDTGAPATARLSQGWFVRQADGKDASQSLRLDYTDWAGTARSAWLLAPADGSYKFVGIVRSATALDPNTCLTAGSTTANRCFASDTIQYNGGDGKYYAATVRPYAPPAGTPRYATATTGAPKYATAVEGSPLTFEANGFAPAGATPPVTYRWRFQLEGCGGPCQTFPENPAGGGIVAGPGGIQQGGLPSYAEPVAGATVTHTWGASGEFAVELTATDAAALIGTTTFTVAVGNVAPGLSLIRCAAAPCPTRTGDPGTPLPLAGAFSDPGAYNNLRVTIDWGDGSRNSECLPSTRAVSGPGVVGDCFSMFGSPLTLAKAPAAAGAAGTFSASHAYATAGTYAGLVTVWDGAAGASEAFTMTVAQGVPQAITFPAPPALTYGGPPVALAATGGASSQPLILAVTTPAVCALTAGALTPLRPGTCTVTASQAGDEVYSPAPAVTHSVAVLPAPLTITANDRAMTFGGAPPAFDARYEGLVNGDTSAVVVGVVTTNLRSGGLTCGAAALTGGAWLADVTPAGTYPITCAGGTADNYALTYLPGTLTIARAATSLAVETARPPLFIPPGGFVLDVPPGGQNPPPGPSPTPSVPPVLPWVAGQPVTITATVAIQGGSGPVGGTVEFRAGGAALAGCAARPVIPVSGVATCTTSALGAGTHDITAAYSGDANLLASTTATAAPLTVVDGIAAPGATATATAAPGGRTASTTTLAPGGPAVAGQPATLTAVVAGAAPGAGGPTGTVTFAAGGTSLGTAPLALVGGAYRATYSATSLAAGAHTITARYGGDGAFLESASAAVTLYVNTDLSAFPRLPGGAYNLKRTTRLAGGALAGVSLAGASLVGADLRGALLTGADLTGATLSSADLRGADLTGANLRGATGLTAAALTGAVWGATTCPDGTTSDQNGGTCLGHL